MLAESLEVLDGKAVPMIELIPPVHQRVYKMGLEHLGVVIGETFSAFGHPIEDGNFEQEAWTS